MNKMADVGCFGSVILWKVVQIKRYKKTRDRYSGWYPAKASVKLDDAGGRPKSEIIRQIEGWTVPNTWGYAHINYKACIMWHDECGKLSTCEEQISFRSDEINF